jgi:HSP20 family molecular chaperone IbpA
MVTTTPLLFARDHYTNLEKMLNRYWNTHLYDYFTTTGDTGEMSTENNETSHKYTFTLPGISPDRVSVRLRSDKATLDIYVDNKLQRTIAPYLWATRESIGYHGTNTTITEENVKVTMEHGLLTVVITPKQKSASSESVELPINGKKFLQEKTETSNELV